MSEVFSGAKCSFDISPWLSQFPLERRKTFVSIKRLLTGNYCNAGTDIPFSKLAQLSGPRLQHFLESVGQRYGAGFPLRFLVLLGLEQSRDAKRQRRQNLSF